MELTSIIVALIAAFGGIVSAVMAYRSNRAKTLTESKVADQTSLAADNARLLARAEKAEQDEQDAQTSMREAWKERDAALLYVALLQRELIKAGVNVPGAPT